ncbi:pimeloyl-ACP methyl ester carboxylesterase [Rhodococcus sp. SMB37]|uniref:alpha/beta fold hydrolase n=1 Tax=Rhodococcus sp. SMB37 TaxID=2512213 RepID=UPI00104617E7|nr:alpha/beta hydrolase [Rhodococcus sp. SMB37]TCN40071.1 pimeloyl-ACP methyl ester carboxylesterase [Rhodococcus sp. SMB37]
MFATHHSTRLRHTTVDADDGVPLAVTETGPVTAELTFVFVHGHCHDTDAWSRLRRALLLTLGRPVRMVFFDHRGHGRSGGAPAETYTLDQIGRDLGAVLDAATSGPVVLVGHSMGGMAILSYARQYPSDIGTRVAGVALISTAADDLAHSGLGRYLHSPAVELFRRAVSRAPRITQRVARWGGRVGLPVAGALHRRRTAALRPGAWLLTLLTLLGSDTSVVTMAGFLRCFAVLDEADALAVLAHLPSLVLCGSRDEWTPFELSAGVASRLPHSELVRVEGAGHSVTVEHPAAVAAALRRLAERVTQAW